eukprot:TRINITY_DN102013_c0_g1_i1.p1 TRINITY_DN102013_c0_g1~~TRINITY_DN102013_c0_g1_i1.p1  ORF type:complete len:410 (+),score=55.65 TRINITY_DN102013_c0_g1_i1:99-1232(+)
MTSASDPSMAALAYTPWVCLHPTNVIRMFKQPKFYVALGISIPCGFLGGLLKYWQTEINPNMLKSVITDNAVYDALYVVVALLCAFRVNAAYLKFWSGATHVYHITGELFDGTSDLIAFARTSKKTKQEIDNFIQLLIRLVSLLNSVIFAELEAGADHQHGVHSESDHSHPASYTYDLIDIQGLNEESLDRLLDANNKVELCYQWLIMHVVEAIDSNLFDVPPPIMARTFGDFTKAMENFHHAQKITEVPFPFPYQISLQLILVCHWILTPIVTVDWTDSLFWTVGFCMTATFSLWFFFAIAVELDAPFQNTRNSVDMRYLQKLLNHRLLAIVDTFRKPTPKLLRTAHLDISRKSLDSSKLGSSFSREVRRRTIQKA